MRNKKVMAMVLAGIAVMGTMVCSAAAEEGYLQQILKFINYV